MPHRALLAALLATAICPVAARAQDRTDDNAVTQAEDAFGFSVGREAIGIYNANSARGFSPTAAGNARLDGLYFDPITPPVSVISDSSSVKVGLSAQGYPFVAPSGIVDYGLRAIENRTTASIVANADNYGTAGLEVDGSFALTGRLSLGYGFNPTHIEYPDGTHNAFAHGEGLILRWHPVPGIEITPFWSQFHDTDDQAGEFYLAAGDSLPPVPRAHVYDGPRWALVSYTNSNHGLLASASPARDWLLRIGAFRSVSNQPTNYANLLYDVMPDGSAQRLTIADPSSRQVSLSGEARITHSVAEGPRLHVFHLSLRARDARHQFGGDDSVDLGALPLGTVDHSPRPDFQFGSLSRDRVRQSALGLAYDGRWKGVGELSFSVSRAWYRKTTDLPGLPAAITRSSPWLYNATAAGNLTTAITAYAGYARGLEESGIAPPNAANRNQPLPAIITEQKDAGIRVALTGKIKAVIGVFDLRRPYFGFDAANSYMQIGSVRSRGAEFSISGSVTPRLDVVAGGMMLSPRVERDAAAVGMIGKRPAGLPGHLVTLNANWRTPLAGLSLDIGALHRGAVPATTDNLVTIPPRARLDLGSHYRFKLAKHDATLRVQMINVLDQIGLGYAGPGIYTSVPGRYVSGYLAVDI